MNINNFGSISQSYIWWPYGEHTSARCQESWRDCPGWMHSLSEVGPSFPWQLTLPENHRAIWHHSTFSRASVDKIWHQLLWVIIPLFIVLNSSIWKSYFGHYNITGIIDPVQLNMCHLDCTNLLRRVLYHPGPPCFAGCNLVCCGPQRHGMVRKLKFSLVSPLLAFFAVKKKCQRWLST